MKTLITITLLLTALEQSGRRESTQENEGQWFWDLQNFIRINIPEKDIGAIKSTTFGIRG